MYISKIKLWNFRKFGKDGEFNLDTPDLDLNFTKGLNVIIGENDSGKTAIIDAIKLVLKTHSYDYIKADDRDFYKDSSRFRIELIFNNLSAAEAKNFVEWLGWNGEGQTAVPYLRVIYDVRRQDKRILPSDVKAGVDNEAYQLTAEAREYLKATYLKPLRDAENELVAKKNSRLSQILLGDPAFKNKPIDHELVRIFNDLNDELKKYFKGEPIEVKNANGIREVIAPQEGKTIKDKIDKYIQAFYNKDNEAVFDSVAGDIKSILEKITLSLQGEMNPGLGTLNRLFMAAELLHLSKSNWSGIRLGLVEEIEAHLHPQAQMQVIEALQRQKEIQLILTTHSPNLASKLNLENLIICNGGNVFPMGSSYTKLASDDYKFLEKFLDTTKANLFFAKGLILVEGWAEEILLSSLAKNIGINFTEKGVSVVNVGNLAFMRYAKIFLRNVEPLMKIPVAILTDVDTPEYEKYLLVDDVGKPIKYDRDKNQYDYRKRDEAVITAETAASLAALTAKGEQNVKYFVAPNWTLEYSLSKSLSFGQVFKNAAKAIHTGTDWDTDFEKALAEKLLNKGLNKTEIAYQMAAYIDNDIEACNKGEIEAKTIAISTDDQNDSINYLVKAIQYATSS